jgi:hypothetical protein
MVTRDIRDVADTGVSGVSHSVGGGAMNHIQSANLEGFLAWQDKLRRGYVEHDPWSGAARYLFDRDLAEKRRYAVAWMAMRLVRRAAYTAGLGLHREPKPRVRSTDAVGAARSIWTSRKAIKRGE